jgi:hypothetical protein
VREPAKAPRIRKRDAFEVRIAAARQSCSEPYRGRVLLSTSAVSIHDSVAVSACFSPYCSCGSRKKPAREVRRHPTDSSRAVYLNDIRRKAASAAFHLRERYSIQLHPPH